MTQVERLNVMCELSQLLTAALQELERAETEVIVARMLVDSLCRKINELETL